MKTIKQLNVENVHYVNFGNYKKKYDTKNYKKYRNKITFKLQRLWKICCNML